MCTKRSKETYVGIAMKCCLYEKRQTETNGDKRIQEFLHALSPKFRSMSVHFICVVINEEKSVGTAKLRCLYETRQTETRVSARLILQISDQCLSHTYE
jgi:hypothetical protein